MAIVLTARWAIAAPPVALEIATERGVQITAPHDWVQLLSTIGIEHVRIRGLQPGDALKAENRGTADQPHYHVLGVLTSRDQLRLPGGTFTRSDRAALNKYFERLGSEGAEAITAPRGRFGLTPQELAAVTADLAQPIDFECQGQPCTAVIGKLIAKFKLQKLGAYGAATMPALRDAEPVADELKGLTAGTGLAIMLRNYGYVLRPGKVRSAPLSYNIFPADSDNLLDSTLGEADDAELKHWPIGWRPAQPASEIAPLLFETRNAEIEGYTLEETLQAIGARIKIPIYVDRAALREKQIDLAAMQVRLARTRASYKRVIDRVLAPARLRSQVRVDEGGTPFLWITR
jgi:hypothetical protein